MFPSVLATFTAPYKMSPCVWTAAATYRFPSRQRKIRHMHNDAFYPTMSFRGEEIWHTHIFLTVSFQNKDKNMFMLYNWILSFYVLFSKFLMSILCRVDIVDY